MNINIKQSLPFLQKGKKLIYYRMHPEAALRYIPIVKILKKNNLDSKKILEVGSGSYGITPYLRKKITGVDTDFSEPEYPLLKQINGTAIKLPFKVGEFEVVILSDVLEHIPEKFRKVAINEAIRVSSNQVVISGPFGKEAAEQDKKLASYSLMKTGQMHPFFKEHLEYGLPEVQDVINTSLKNERVSDAKVVGTYFNLDWREKLMKQFISNNKLQYYFYLKGLMPLVPFLLRKNSKPCYRSLILIKLAR